MANIKAETQLNFTTRNNTYNDIAKVIEHNNNNNNNFNHTGVEQNMSNDESRRLFIVRPVDENMLGNPFNKDNSEDEKNTLTFQFEIPKTLPLQPVEIIGIGSFSTVCRAEAAFGNGKISFAIKKLEHALSKEINPSIEDISRVAREIIILKTILQIVS